MYFFSCGRITHCPRTVVGRESSIIPIHKYYTGSNELNLITMQRKQGPLNIPCRPPCDPGALLDTIGLKAQLCRLP